MIILLSESSNGMDVLEVLDSGMIGIWGGGALDQRLLQILELYGRRESIGRLTTLPVTAIGLLDVSPDGYGTTALASLEPCRHNVGTP
jgi:hypothetical protein